MGRLGLGLAVILILIVVRTYPRRAHDVAAVAANAAAYAAKPQATRQSGGLASSRQSRSRHVAAKARNLVEYYLAFAFKLFYYVLFDL